MSGREKELIVVGGPNGSGKTTFVNQFLTVEDWPYIGADQIAVEMSPDDPADAQVAAGREFIRRIDERLAGEGSFIVESTLSGKTFARTLREAGERGFERTIHFVFLDNPSTSVARVAERVRKGGHHVPEDDVRRRFSRSLRNFWELYRPLSEFWMLGCNAGRTFEEVARGDSVATVVANRASFQDFFRLAEIEQVPTTSTRLTSEEMAAKADRLLRIGQEAVRRAQEESRRMGVPNVYSIDGVLYYELSNGELTTEDPDAEPRS